MNDLIWKREGEAFKAEIDDKLDNTEEHDDDISHENAENTVARNAIKEKEIEIDAANGKVEVEPKRYGESCWQFREWYVKQS